MPPDLNGTFSLPGTLSPPVSPSAFANMWESLTNKQLPEIRILMLGLEEAGKTTLLTMLASSASYTTVKVGNFNIETATFNNMIFMALDSKGRRSNNKPLQLRNVDGLVLVVDSTRIDLIPIVRDELMETLTEVHGAPLLVFANKQDLPDALGVADVTEQLMLNGVQDRLWFVQPSCATNGTGTKEGRGWLWYALTQKSAPATPMTTPMNGIRFLAKVSENPPKPMLEEPKTYGNDGLETVFLEPGAGRTGSEKKVDTNVRRSATLSTVAKTPALSFSIPVSSYGVAIMLPVLIEPPSCTSWFYRIGEAYLRLVLNIVIQVFLTIILGKMVRNFQESLLNGPPDCEHLSDSLALTCIWLHVACVMTDMIETGDLMQMVWVEINQVQGSSEIFQYKSTDDGPELISGGMTFLRKVMVTILVIIPKFCISVLVLFFGGAYLAASASNADLLLNSLAVVFIMDVDELLFALMCPARTRHLIEALPPFETHKENAFWEICRKWGFLTKTCISSLAVILIWYVSYRCGGKGGHMKLWDL